MDEIKLKKLSTRIQNKHDFEINWLNAKTFIPMAGEIIIYDGEVDPNGNLLTTSKGKAVLPVTVNGVVRNVPYNYPRIKIGNGYDTVNDLEFIKTAGDGSDSGGSGLTELEIEELVKKYAEESAGAVVYLNTEEHVGGNIELQDVYPIQTNSTVLKIISKNILTYSFDEKSISGLTVKTNNTDGAYVKVSGTATETISDQTIDLAEITLHQKDKYTLSTLYAGVAESNTKCYIEYSFYDADGNLVQAAKKLSITPITFDSAELNCSVVKLQLCLSAASGDAFVDSNAQVFKLQLEHGDKVTSWTKPRSEAELSDKTITICGKNLFNPNDVFEVDRLNKTDFTTLPSDSALVLNGVESYAVTNTGVYYLKGTMTEDFYITLTNEADSITKIIKTPLLSGNIFTLIFNVVNISDSIVEIRDVQVVSGHTDYEIYESWEPAVTKSSTGGLCDISKIKYPYSFVSLDSSAADAGYTIYLSYDPALSRTWTEKQLESLETVQAALISKCSQLEALLEEFKNSANVSKEDITMVDKTTGAAYAVYVDNGKLMLEMTE